MATATKPRKIFDNRYEVLSIVGRGALSVVYHARYVNPPHAEVALKVLVDKPGNGSISSDQLRKEALAMVSSRHRHVLRVDDFHSVGSLSYLCLEYAPESDLRRYTERLGGKLPIEQAELFCKQVLEALTAVHRAGIIHRDVKPENILVMHGREVKLCDFSTALLPSEEPSLQELQAGVGTMSYMAPEILLAEGYGTSVDTYALAVSFYELLSGKHPFDHAPLAEQLNVRKTANISPLHLLNSEVPEYLSAIIARAMSFTPADRFQSAEEMLEALNRSESYLEVQSQFNEVMYLPEGIPDLSHNEHAPLVDAQQDEVKNFAESYDSKDTANNDAPAPSTIEAEAQVANMQHSSIDTQQNPASETPKAEALSQIEALRLVSAAETVLLDPTTLKLDDPEQTQLLPAVESIAPPPAEMISAGTGDTTTGTGKQVGPNRLMIFLIVMVATTMIVLALAQNVLLSSPEKKAASGTKAFERLLPSFDATARFSFPRLPAGIYQGSINGLLPNRAVPMTIIVSGNNTLAFSVLIGVEGWIPVTLPLPDRDEGSVRLASNGIILDLTGTIFEGTIEGSFKNLVSGETGSWRVAPLKEK